MTETIDTAALAKRIIKALGAVAENDVSCTLGDAIIHAPEARALAALLRGVVWQPIETAPKDGSQFLAANDEVFDVSWSTTTDRHEPAWAFACAVFPFDDKSDERPTHWMPLPSPPLSTTKEG